MATSSAQRLATTTSLKSAYGKSLSLLYVLNQANMAKVLHGQQLLASSECHCSCYQGHVPKDVAIGDERQVIERAAHERAEKRSVKKSRRIPIIITYTIASYWSFLILGWHTGIFCESIALVFGPLWTTLQMNSPGQCFLSLFCCISRFGGCWSF